MLLGTPRNLSNPNSPDPLLCYRGSSPSTSTFHKISVISTNPSQPSTNPSQTITTTTTLHKTQEPESHSEHDQFKMKTILKTMNTQKAQNQNQKKSRAWMRFTVS
ncbi:hypothetical protein GBA52_001645 [Prunus armeniaca]|nr:hypothetical protein GBA52_001645 [Prunus armeniaca]